MKNLELSAVNRQPESPSVQESFSGIIRPSVAPFMKQPKFRRLFDRHAGVYLR